MTKISDQKRRKLDIEPIAVSKKAFLDLLEQELPDDFNVIMYEFHRISSDDSKHVGTSLQVSLFVKDFVTKLIQRENGTGKEPIIHDLTGFDEWKQVAEWFNE